MTHRTSVSVDDEMWSEYRGSGLSITELIQLGLKAHKERSREPAEAASGAANGGNEIRVAGEERERLLSSFGRRIENLCAANEQLVTLLEREDTPAEQAESLTAAVTGLLKLLTSGYTLQAAVQRGERVIPARGDTGAPDTAPHAHTIAGPRECGRCQILRDNYPLGQGYEDAGHRPAAPPSDEEAWQRAEIARISDSQRRETAPDDDGHGGPF